MADLTPEQLESLRQFSSCTISNTVETFNVRPRNKGFMTPNIKCIFPDMGNMIGYAVTAVIQAEAAPSARMNASRIDFIDEILKIPEPRIIVMKDLDYPNVIGSFWGEATLRIGGHPSGGSVGATRGISRNEPLLRSFEARAAPPALVILQNRSFSQYRPRLCAGAG